MRITVSVIALVVGVVLVGYVIAIARIVRRLDDAELSAQLFLNARRIRRFLALAAIAVGVFLGTLAAELLDQATSHDIFETVHDITHLVVVTIALAGIVGLRQIARDMAPEPPRKIDLLSETLPRHKPVDLAHVRRP